MEIRINFSRFMIGVIAFLSGVLFFQIERSESMGNIGSQEVVSLPAPQFDGRTSIEKSLIERRSVRQYRDNDLTLSELSQLLWAGQGVTHTRDFQMKFEKAKAKKGFRFILLLSACPVGWRISSGESGEEEEIDWR